MKTNLTVIKISSDEMIDSIDGSYNISIWNKRVNDYLKFKNVQFYYADKVAGVYDYKRFFVSYITPENLFFFNEFNAFSASLTNNGFCKVSIDENGDVHTELFKSAAGKEGYAENCKENRRLFALTLTPINVMVSNCI